jgi:Icc-related predicted phosphoesterase
MPLFGKKKQKKLSRLFFATDLHGSEVTYKKFINAGKFYDVNILIMGGDITGKLLIPIIKEKNGNYRATLQGSLEHLSTEEELKEFHNRIGMLGFYSQIMEEDEFKVMQQDQSAVDTLFHKLARERLDAWIDLAETRLAGTGIKVFATGGNDDDPEVLSVLKREGAQSFFGCEGECVHVDDDHTMISVGFSTPTPWDTPREVPDEKLYEFIEEMVAKVPNMQKAIFNFHDPPKDSTLDTCPQLDWNTDPPTPITSGGQIVYFGAGSASVRKAIETHQPMLGLHGHIHEAQSVAKIGRTTCVNPGSEYGEGRLRGCIVTFSDGEVEGFQMTSG